MNKKFVYQVGYIYIYIYTSRAVFRKLRVSQLLKKLRDLNCINIYSTVKKY